MVRGGKKTYIREDIVQKMSRRIPVPFRKRGYYIVRLKPKEIVDLTNTADYDSEYAIVQRDQSGVRVYQGDNIGPTALRNGTRLQKFTGVENIESGPFNQEQEVLEAFRSLRSTGEKLSHGVELAREVMDVPENEASVEKNFQLTKKLSRAVVETTVVHEITPEEEIANIDKILCCGGQCLRSFKPTLHVTYIFFAAVIAAAGLWTNSGPSVVASMLVSTMMEPINGMRTAVSDLEFTRRKGKRFLYHLLTLLVDMCICLGVGAIAGALSAADHVNDDAEWTDLTTNDTFYYTRLEYLSGQNTENIQRETKNGRYPILLPNEMSGRTSEMGLLVALVVAGASAFALYFADRADNKSALVGIGISASLLPPMVNAGMLWALSAHDKINIDGANLAPMGGRSFALTWINVGVILAIWAIMSKILPWCRRRLPCKEKPKKMPVVPGTRVEMAPRVPAIGFGEKTRLLF